MKTMYIRKSKRGRVWELRSADLKFWTLTIIPSHLSQEWAVSRLQELNPNAEIIVEVSK